MYPSRLSLNTGAEVLGGTVTTTGSGLVIINSTSPTAGSAVRLDDLTIDAGIRVQVANARDALGGGDVLVQNGDILADVDFRRLVREHLRAGAAATLAVCGRSQGEGTVGIGANRRVARLRGEQFEPERHSADFAGIQLLSPMARDRLPAEGCLVADLYQPLLREGLTVQAVDVVSSWVDVGSLSGYLQANLAWLDERGLSSFVAEDASVAPGISLDQCLVGSAARLDGHGTLRRCVVWPGAAVAAPLEDAVVMPPRTVVPAG